MADVNKPIDERAKEADINQKLQLYGIMSGFQSGKVPSNEQIDVALNSLLASRALARPSKRLSAEGQALVADVREVINLAKYLLLSKNKDNLLQDFIWQTQQFDVSNINSPITPATKETAKQHGNDSLSGLRTLGTLIITNGQFRKLLKDATTLFRDIASDAAVNVAGRVRPFHDKLDQIDQPAEDNTWHDTPDLSKDAVRQHLKGVYNGNPVDDIKSAANNGMNNSNVNNTSDPRAVDAQSGLTAAKDTLTQRVGNNIDDDTKDYLKATSDEYRNRLKKYLRQKMPEERRDQTIWRLKKMVLECQQHPDYAQAIQTLLDLVEHYGHHGRNVVKDTTGTAQDTRSSLASAEADLKTLIERFANGTSTDNLWESIRQIYMNADQDDELKNWFKAMDKYIRRCLLQQGYILEDASTHEWNRLHDQGHYLLREKYRAHTNRTLDELKFLGEQFDRDSQNKAFGKAVQKLFEDLGSDDNEKPTLKPHLLKDLRDVILPAAFESISYVPIPRIEFRDEQVDVVIENLILESDNFMPNVIEFNGESHFKWGRKKEASELRQTLEVKVKGIQMDLRNVCYYVRHKKGFPAISDQGSANIFLPGDGFSCRIKMSTADSADRQNYFKVHKVDVDLKRLNIQLVKSNHKVLFAIVKPLMLRVLRPALQKAAEMYIKNQVDQLDAKFWSMKQEADRVSNEVKDHPEEAPNLYSRYASAMQKQFLQGKKKADNVNKKVNVAVTQEDSMFPDIKLDRGISSKATEYRQMARQGDLWQSPVFSIGNAAPTSDIPAAPKIERKAYDHHHHQENDQYAQYGRGAAHYGGSSPQTSHNTRTPQTGYNTSSPQMGYNTDSSVQPAQSGGYQNTNADYNAFTAQSTQASGYNVNTGYNSPQAAQSGNYRNANPAPMPEMIHGSISVID